MIDNLKKKWYAVQTLSGVEQHVARSLREHIKLNSMEDFFGKIIVPAEEVIEIKGGKRKKSERKFFPGYILIQMIMTQKSWHFVRKIPKVISFVGGKMDNPSAISKREIDSIIDKLQKIGDKPRPKVLFEPGELVRVNSGPFSDFNGIVEEVDYEKNRLKVSVLIFGRSTPVELNFSQVEKG